MNKRCIVSVGAGGFYCKNLDRLSDSFLNKVDNIINYSSHGDNTMEVSVNWSSQNGKETGIDLILWRNSLPPGSRPHSESPYGFKVHAIKAAYEKGYTSILWLDSAAYAVKEDVSPIFEKIEKEGYYVMCKDDALENWVGDTTLKAYNNTKREQLIGMYLPSGSCYGFYLNGIGAGIFHGLMKAEQNGLFKSEVIGEGKWHRHDEAILAMELGKRLFSYDPLFQSDSPECVIKSGGWL